MGKAQVWVTLFLIGAIAAQIVVKIEATQALKSGHPIQAINTLNPMMAVYLVVGFVGLVLLSDAAPELAVGIAALLFVGSILTVGPDALKAVK